VTSGPGRVSNYSEERNPEIAKHEMGGRGYILGVLQRRGRITLFGKKRGLGYNFMIMSKRRGKARKIAHFRSTRQRKRKEPNDEGTGQESTGGTPSFLRNAGVKRKTCEIVVWELRE